VRIPTTLAQETAGDEGEEVNVRADGDRIVVERPQPKSYRLRDLLAGVTKVNHHAAVDFGKPTGREIWYCRAGAQPCQTGPN
jgi:antitoxin component of MazEF toxin-antitoxin module